MIVVNVELFSARGKQDDKHLFTMLIINDGTGDTEIGNYNVFLGARGETNLKSIIEDAPIKARIEGYPRMTKHVGDLVQKALEYCNISDAVV